MLEIVVAAMRFSARLEEEAAPQSVAAFRRLLPLQSRVIHARWSGEATWIPFGDLEVGVGPENATCYPAPGELLLYPGGVSETEILFPYGAASFASKAGPLAGNHFATIVEGGEQLRELGRLRALGGRPGHRVRGELAGQPAQSRREHLDRERDVLLARQLVGRVTGTPIQASHEEHPALDSG